MHTGTQFFVQIQEKTVLMLNFKLFAVSGVYESGRKNHLRLDKALTTAHEEIWPTPSPRTG